MIIWLLDWLIDFFGWLVDYVGWTDVMSVEHYVRLNEYNDKLDTFERNRYI